MNSRRLPADPARILLVRLSSLGDVVCTMPLAMELRRLHPRARLLWAVEPAAAPLLEGHGSGAETVIVPRTGGPGVRMRTVMRLRSLRPDLVIDAQGNVKSGVVARLAARGAPVLGFAPGDVREWPNRILTTLKAPPTSERHKVRQGLALLRGLGARPPADPPDFGIRARFEEVEAGRALLRRSGIPPGRPVALLHVGNLRDVRAWNAASIVALARRLVAREWAVAIEGPDPLASEDGTLLDGLMVEGVADLTSGVPLRTLLGILDLLAAERRERGLSHVLVSPDTLAPHLAAAVGLPVVLLAGPQDPDRSGPFGVETRFVRAWEGLPCAPCRKRRCAYPEPRACMRRITVESVHAAVEEIAHASPLVV